MNSDDISKYIFNNARVETSKVSEDELREMIENNSVDLYKLCKYQNLSIKFIKENNLKEHIEKYNEREEHDISFESLCEWQKIDISMI